MILWNKSVVKCLISSLMVHVLMQSIVRLQEEDACQRSAHDTPGTPQIKWAESSLHHLKSNLVSFPNILHNNAHKNQSSLSANWSFLNKKQSKKKKKQGTTVEIDWDKVNKNIFKQSIWLNPSLNSPSQMASALQPCRTKGSFRQRVHLIPI